MPHETGFQDTIKFYVFSVEKTRPVQETQSLNHSSIRNATLIIAIARYSQIVINIVFSAVLARLLSPEEFGVVAVITVFTTFFLLLSDMGFGVAVIQNRTISQKEISDVFTISMLLGLFISLSFALLSFPIAFFYHNEVYKTICPLLSVSLFFSTLNSIPSSLLRKEKKFGLIAKRSILVTFSSGIITIVLAYLGWKYYALVFQAIISSIAVFLWNYLHSPLRISLHPNFGIIKKMWGMSFFQFSFNFINYFARNLDNLLIGYFMGPAPLAFYNKAYRLMLYPVSNLTHVITPVLHPIFSEHQNDRAYILGKYKKILKLLSLSGVLISSICFFAADEIIAIMFGKQWDMTIPCFRMLSLSIWAQMVTASTGAIFQSLGNTKLMFKAGTIAAIFITGNILIGLATKDLSLLSLFVAIGFNGSFLINFLIIGYFGFKTKALYFLRIFFPDLIIAALIFCIMTIQPIHLNNVFASLGIKILFSSILFLLGLVITQQQKEFFSFFHRNKK